jgi:hypothetical protein
LKRKIQTSDQKDEYVKIVNENMEELTGVRTQIRANNGLNKTKRE